MNEKIRVLVIYEILGRPADHIKVSLEQLIDRIGENPGIKIIERKVHEPHLVEEKKDNSKKLNVEGEVFSTFAEVEMELDNLMLVFSLVMNTLPSNIEIIQPEELRLRNFDLSAVVSDLTIKLHRYDEVTKAMLIEKNQLINLIEEMDKNIRSLGGKSNVEIKKDEEEATVMKQEKENSGKNTAAEKNPSHHTK
ncbi:MAG: hypothetical protein RL557_557 [archaeon]|jgi:hypothetical protein